MTSAPHLNQHSSLYPLTVFIFLTCYADYYSNFIIKYIHASQLVWSRAQLVSKDMRASNYLSSIHCYKISTFLLVEVPQNLVDKHIDWWQKSSRIRVAGFYHVAQQRRR